MLQKDADEHSISTLGTLGTLEPWKNLESVAKTMKMKTLYLGIPAIKLFK